MVAISQFEIQSTEFLFFQPSWCIAYRTAMAWVLKQSMLGILKEQQEGQSEWNGGNDGEETDQRGSGGWGSEGLIGGCKDFDFYSK